MLRPALSARVGLRLAHSRVVPLRPRPQQRQLARTQTRCFSIYEVPPVPQLTEAILNTPLSSYALTIVCLTFVLRAGLTLPTTLWQRRRMARVREIIGPEMKRKNDELAPLVARQSRKDGLSYEEYQKRLKKELANYQSNLHRQHGTHPTITMLVPLMVNIPILISTSYAIRNALEVPNSPVAAEYVSWLSTTLGEPGPTLILPLLGGCLAFANAELAGWSRDRALNMMEEAEEKAREKLGDVSIPQPTTGPIKPIQAPTSKRQLSTSAVDLVAVPKRRSVPRPGGARPATPTPRAPASSPQDHMVEVGGDPNAKAQKVVNVSTASVILTYMLRGLAVIFIPVAMYLPTALPLYWTSSMAFTLGQSTYFAIVDKRERDATAAAAVQRKADAAAAEAAEVASRKSKPGAGW